VRAVPVAVVGLALVVIAVVAYFGMIFVLERFTYRTWLFDAVVLTGVALAIVGLLAGATGPVPWIAVVVGLAWFPVSRRELTLQGSKHLTLRVGDHLPAFEAWRSDGTAITDRDLVAAAPAILVLYRGWWCPSTKVLMSEQLADHARLSEAGLRTFAASVDPPEMAVGMQAYVGDRITIISGFPVAVLESIGARDRRGAPWYDRLRFRAPKGDIAMPAALVIDPSGRITYAFRADRVDERARPKDILASLAH
jgi:peroxiredoxin